MKKERGCFFLRIVCNWGKIKVNAALGPSALFLIEPALLFVEKTLLFSQVCLLYPIV
jgi:hypothetical protein